MLVGRWLGVVALAVSSMVVGVGCGAEDEPTTGAEQNATAKAGRFETFTGVDGQTYFHVLAGNGQKVLQSEGYVSLAGATKGIESVRKNGVDADAYEILESADGRYYFNLVAQNGEIVGTSQMYASRSNATRGRDAVIKVIGRAQRERAAAEGGAKFAVFAGLDGQDYFHLQAGNGEIVVQSEGYTREDDAFDGADTLREVGKAAEAYEILEASDGQFYFRIVAGNGETVGWGETYVSRSNAERAADTVRELLVSELVADAE